MKVRSVPVGAAAHVPLVFEQGDGHVVVQIVHGQVQGRLVVGVLQRDVSAFVQQHLSGLNEPTSAGVMQG